MAQRRAPRLPLSGYRVVEMAHHLAAPLAAMHLGDFGADVVKVETLEGDDWRRWGRPSPAGMSQLFLAVNRNKRSVALDLATPAGRRVLDRLLATADVLVTNYAPAVLKALGLDARRLSRRYRKLIVCTLSAFGARGPDADRRAFDIVVAGETGLLIPHPDGQSAPLVPAAPIADTGSALMLAYGIAHARLNRERGGSAQHVDSALVNACIALQAHRFIWLDGEPAPELQVPPMTVYGAYATADGFITIAALAARLWARLCKALGLEALLDDPRYTPWANLTARQLELRPVLDKRFRELTTDAWLAILTAAGVPAGRVNWGARVFEHPQLTVNGVVARMRHPQAGPMRTMGFPLKLAATPARLRRPAPLLGAHTRAVLAELGYRPAEITRLRAAGAVGGR
ncbi:MAG: CoA transferase [Candidatus Rokubacteria bacterium]|nr:CoA transferase [Candidatus Rokubacteria bacterium]